MEQGARYARRIAKRRLCYLTTKQDVPKEELQGKLSLGSVDRMFDDLDFREYVPTLFQFSDSDTEEIQEVQHSSPLDLSDKTAMPSKEDLNKVQTSSPLDENSDGIPAQLETNEVAKRLSPILNDSQQENNTARNQPDSDIYDDTESSPRKTVPGSPTSGHKIRLPSPMYVL
ncbi:uncharacterized protein LOC144072772 [Stigmatopora argus]